MSESTVEIVQQLFTDCKRAIHFGIATKLVRPIKMCLSGAYICKHLSYSERPKTRRCFFATTLIVALECFSLLVLFFDPEDRGSTLPRNFGGLLRYYTKLRIR
jgi:hypothetical protein